MQFLGHESTIPSLNLAQLSANIYFQVMQKYVYLFQQWLQQ